MCGFCSAARLPELCAGKSYGELKAPISAQSGSGGVLDPLALTIPDNSTTTETIQIGEVITETLEFEGDADWFRIELTAGDVIQIDLTRATSDPLEDPLLRVFNDQSQLVAFNDDLVLGVDQESRIFFEATETGTYFIEATSFGGLHDGDYQLSVAAAPVGTDTLSSSPLYNGLVTDFVMDTGATSPTGAMEVRYYFAAANEAFNGFGQSITSDVAWTSYEEQQIELALEVLESALNLDFIEVGTQGEADLKFAAGEIGAGNLFGSPGNLGFAFFPGSSALASLVTLNVEGFGWDRNAGAGDTYDGGLEQGGQGFLTIMHELGHAFGLEHSFEENRSILFPGLTDDFSLDQNGRPTVPGPDGSADFPFEDTGDFDLSQSTYTVMSYADGWTDHPLGPQLNTTSGFTQARSSTLMAIDLAVLQDVYGANPTAAAGNDTYTLEDVTSPKTQYQAVWDTGGVDEITYAGSDSATIDLRAASLRVEEGGGGFISHIAGTRGGWSIARGVEIENAVSGDGIDTLIGNALDNLLDAGGAEDNLFGGAGNDTLFGRAAADFLEGGDGHDLLYGGDFADGLRGGGGNDTLYGEDGDDGFSGEEGADSYFGGEGEDTLSFALLIDPAAPLVLDLETPSNSTGIAEGDTVSSIERIIGFETQQNTIIGDASDMTIVGGMLADSLDGGAGNDLVQGGEDNDDLAGGAGNDSVEGGLGNDTVSGDSGNDVLEGGEGTDVLFGGDGDDRFNLFGTSLFEPEHADIFYGGDGDDTAYASDTIDQTFYGGDGQDLISYDAVPVGVFVSLAAPQGFTVFESVEGLAGTIEDDGLTGDDGDNLLIGFDGGDLIYGGAGNDTIDPGPNDTFMITFAVDVVYGGDGNDTIIAGPDEDTIFGGSGTDFWSFERQDAVEASLASPGPTVLDSIEGLIGSSGNDTLTGDDADNTLAGRAGADTLDGGAGEDTADYSASLDQVFVAVDGSLAGGGDSTGDVLSGIEHLLGSSLADLLRGDDGSNILIGGTGGDYLQGEGGNDTLLGGEGNDVLEGGAGLDLLDGGAGDGDFLSVLDATGPAIIDLVDPSNTSPDYAGDTLISIEGILGTDQASNTIIGNDEGFQLVGGSKDDMITGGAGQDVLVGFAGNDTIAGGAERDLFFGDAGDDRLTGGIGQDTFLFIDDGQDAIADFDPGADRVIFTGLGLGFGDLQFSGGTGDAVISYGADPLDLSSITFEGVLESDLNPTPGSAPAWIIMS